MSDVDIAACRDRIIEHHYTHSVPSGKSWYFMYEDAIIIWAIPANPYISKVLVGEPNRVLELSRLWAPDGHRVSLLTETISRGIKWLRGEVTTFDALVSYADPNVGHKGGVYRAASWVYTGQSEETRAYRGSDGRIVARRKFHSGGRSMRKAEIEAMGFIEIKLPGKYRFAHGLTRGTKRRIEKMRVLYSV